MEAKIKPQDLRIGNILQDKAGKTPITVDIILRNSIKCLGLNYSSAVFEFTMDEVEPIELSEDWLRRMGMLEIYKTDYTVKYELPSNPAFEFVFKKTIGEKVLRFYGFEIKCDTVHHFQNIIYHLTGSELTITDINNIEVK